MKSLFYTLILITLLLQAPVFFALARETKNETGFLLNQQRPLRTNLLVSGRVKDAATGEPVPNVSVRVMGSSTINNTNMDGYFTIHDVPSDTAVIVFTVLGYAPLNYQLAPDKSFRNLDIQLTSVANALEEVVITGKKDESFKLNQKIGLIKLSPAAINTLPNLGEKDIFRSFQLMPGISAGNEHSAGLYVRGGTPDQNLVLFDGFTVYNVDHMFGFFSAFNVNAVKDVQLYKGTFEAKYGGRLSSVVDITGKEGNKKDFNAGFDLGLMSLNGFVETPIGKKLSGFLTYRRSYQSGLYKKIANGLRGEADDEPSGPPNRFDGGTPGGPAGGPRGRTTGSSGITSFFDDLNTKLTYSPNQKDVIGWSFYTGKDKLDQDISSMGNRSVGVAGGTSAANTDDITEWGNTGTSLKWSRKWNPQLFSHTLISYSNYFSNRVNTRTMLRDSVSTIAAGIIEDNNLKDFSVKSDFEWSPGKRHSFGIGYQLTRNDISYLYARSDTASIIDRHTQGNTYAFYLQDRINLINSKLVLIPGIRSSYFSPTGKFYHEPRFSLSLNLTENLKLKGSAGQYYQFAKRVVREDLLQGSRDFWTLADDSNLPVGSSVQYVAGISWENNDYLVDIEAYSKKLEGLSEHTLRFAPRPGQNSSNFEEHFYEGTGTAKGIDFLVQKKFGRYNGWLGYTLGDVINNFPVYGASNFFASNDVRHELKMVHLYKIKRFDFSLSWLYLTGKPYTAPTGGYQVTLLDGTTQEYLVVSEKNSLRLPGYHRLDAAATFNFGKPRKVNGAITLSFFNIYNRRNTWYKNFEVQDGEIIETDMNYLGFTPNLSISFKLK